MFIKTGDKNTLGVELQPHSTGAGTGLGTLISKQARVIF